MDDNELQVRTAQLTSGKQLLNEHAADFGIGGTEFRNKLDETHWAIKRLDVIETLNNNGCTIKLF